MTQDDDGLWIRFWGVRGSIACPSPDHIEFGGNTSCIEVGAGDEVIVLDAGTGIRNLGMSFLERGIREATICLTHTHWDHINGFPFFVPAYQPDKSFHIRAGHLADAGGVKHVLAGQMARPMFPVPLSALQAEMTFTDFRAGESFSIGDVLVKTAPLRHPDGSTGYRLEYGGKSVCYVTDTEHTPGEPDKNVMGLIEGADLVIYDSTYTDDEFPAHIGWGHSTWQEGVRLAEMCNVSRLAIFHHDPYHDDSFMRALSIEAKARFDGAFVAREGMRIDL